ncbi:hypothetical protein J2Z83_003089 [Virgibacillus natechei]|uniref:DUF3021 family protein n=1 Tax=Virgibacillus natechei TaxID=1216297 RepID=A0ABS4IJ26_9BACI|nr:hypothetical protein [Virgibacillus natechei]MBP1970952.1 hypothetical protein [Virgibacillus natechei]UZD12720.1 hypothetical protein OLD84_17790 [Virgibacillus natechei]
MQLFVKLAAIGIFSGVVMGGFLKVVEQLMNIPVYVLLLNVDYFPIIQDWQMSEFVEFLLHILVSVALVIILYGVFDKWKMNRKMYPYILANLLIGGLLFVTTTFSVRTPAITDLAAFLYWMIAHLIFGMFVGVLIVLMKRKKD